jgi:hypothetical protein
MKFEILQLFQETFFRKRLLEVTAHPLIGKLTVCF